MNTPSDKIMCLAHAHDRTPRNHKTPPAWCERYVTCLRHQAISQVPYDGSHTVKSRVCMPGQFDQFLAVDRSSEKTCNYPKCDCPFDAPADPNWCARGYRKGDRS